MVHSVTIVIYTKQFDMQLCLTLAQTLNSESTLHWFVRPEPSRWWNDIQIDFQFELVHFKPLHAVQNFN